jgi:hypothetical protein
VPLNHTIIDRSIIDHTSSHFVSLDVVSDVGRLKTTADGVILEGIFVKISKILIFPIQTAVQCTARIDEERSAGEGVSRVNSFIIASIVEGFIIQLHVLNVMRNYALRNKWTQDAHYVVSTPMKLV